VLEILNEFENIRLLVDMAIILFAALGFGLVAQKLRQPVILGYLFAGIAIGPYMLKFIGRVEDVHVLAEIGVSLLMFVVGLEFAPRHLKKVWKISVFGGYLEMAFMILLGYLLGFIFGLSYLESLFLGGIISISSTIIIVKMLQEFGELEQLHGRVMIGLLIVEDIGAIIVITVLRQVGASQAHQICQPCGIQRAVPAHHIRYMLGHGNAVRVPWAINCAGGIYCRSDAGAIGVQHGRYESNKTVARCFHDYFLCIHRDVHKRPFGAG
jgi:CPA2 family monovalent cation:H+ antiporter-2